MRSKEQIINDAEEDADGPDEEGPERLPNRGDLYDIPRDVPGAPE